MPIIVPDLLHLYIFSENVYDSSHMFSVIFVKLNDYVIP